jgi:Bacteriophage holin of superfamily 6 (Holin_LLH)
MDIQSIIGPVLQDLLYAGAVSLVGFIIGFVKTKLGTEGMKKVQAELYHKQSVASDAVNYVEQKFIGLSSSDKFSKAADYISNALAEKGIKVSSNEIEVLVESTLARFKDVFEKQWNEAEGETTPEVASTPIQSEVSVQPIEEQPVQQEEVKPDATPIVTPAAVAPEVVGESTTPVSSVDTTEEYPVAVDPVGK